jgi:hypothetical protein
MSRKFAVVTTYNQQGLTKYAQRFINTFDKNMPLEVDLLLYNERATPKLPSTKRNIRSMDAERELRTTLVEFKKRWKDDPRANGQGPDKRRLDHKKAFKWDAIRFSNKVYAIFDAVKKTDADVLIWMDADSVVHSPMSFDFLDKFVPEDVFLCYAGRKNKYTECGWYSINLRHPHADKFLTEFQRMYDDANNGIFKLKEWHDSYVFDVVKDWHTQEWGAVNKDFSNGLIEREGHPIINSELGAYIDHLKGDRKLEGQSSRKDLKVQRTEDYWKNIR